MRKAKKSWALRLMFLVLIFTLISTSLMSGTMAKYVTAGSGKDSARVAKWGVTIVGTGTLFSESYETFDTTYTGPDSVMSAGAVDKVVAPGTSGSLGTLTITGSPEVACRIAVTIKSSSMAGWDYDLNTSGTGNPDYYKPIIWMINDSAVTPSSGETPGSFEALVAYLGSYTVDFAPNATITAGNSLAISWVWPFSVNDAGDTYYGNKLTPPTVSLEFDVTITQIDKFILSTAEGGTAAFRKDTMLPTVAREAESF